MPELPEVETVVNTLKNQILGEKIKQVNIYYERMFESDPHEFKTLLIGETLKDIKRYGKYMFFIFDHVSFISHLRMEGKYFIKHVGDNLEKHEHVEFIFESGRVLRYHDTRKFGIMKLVKTTDFKTLLKEDEIAKLGREANDPKFSKEELYDLIKTKTEPIKTTLLNQEIICGLGNIYVDEVLFSSGINPLTKGCTLTLEDAENILVNSRRILSAAIEAGGTTIRSYTSSLGVTGRFQVSLNVHTMDGKPCPKCGTTILKTRVGGRGTYYCPTCQKLKQQVIGITGSIGTGKSAVSKYLISLGYQVIDADKIVKSLYEKDSYIKLIEDNFGSDYIINNQIDKVKLAALVFNNQEELNKLNNLIHPLVYKEMERLIKKSTEELIFLDIPLLYESNGDKLCNKVILVYVPKDIEVERLMNRDNISLDVALQRINAQMDIEQKKTLSPIIIDNSGDLCYTYKQIDELLKTF